MVLLLALCSHDPWLNLWATNLGRELAFLKERDHHQLSLAKKSSFLALSYSIFLACAIPYASL